MVKSCNLRSPVRSLTQELYCSRSIVHWATQEALVAQVRCSGMFGTMSGELDLASLRYLVYGARIPRFLV